MFYINIIVMIYAFHVVVQINLLYHRHSRFNEITMENTGDWSSEAKGPGVSRTTAAYPHKGHVMKH